MADAVILGRRELAKAFSELAPKTLKKVLQTWIDTKANDMARAARRSAPRDRRTPRRKPESARLWKSIRASKVKNLRKFPGFIARSIVYSAGTRGARSYIRARKRLDRRNKSRVARGLLPQQMGKKARHFHLVVRGTKSRRQNSTGRSTGVMPINDFWGRVASAHLQIARGEVGAQLRDAYDKAIQKHIKTYLGSAKP